MTDIRDSDALKAHIDSYLVGLKASMWANWFIDAADRRALAVEWVAELLHGLGFEYTGEFGIDSRRFFELAIVTRGEKT